MTFVRTVLGDIDPAGLGVTYSHEHLVIGPSHTVDMSPDFLLVDVDLAVAELAQAQALGLRSVIDAMPIGAGRDVRLLAEVSARSGIQVVAPTGLHHERHYPPRHWSWTIDAEELADLFTADIEQGIDALDYNGPNIRRTAHRAGVIKVGGSAGGPSDRDAPVFAAAAVTQARTGCPILTHCDGGTGALEQVAMLVAGGADPAHIALSHVDRVVDRGYQREIFATGAFVEYDQGFRWKTDPNGTLQLLEWAAEDGTLGQVVLGLDAARQGYWSVYGGSPGMAFLLDGFADQLRQRGLGDAQQQQLFVTNPASVFSFAEVRP